MVDFTCLMKGLGWIGNPRECMSSVNMWNAVTSWDAVKMPFAVLLGMILALVVAGSLVNWAKRNFGGG